MSLSRIRFTWALAAIVVLAAALVPVAGANSGGGIQAKNPWYAYDAAVRKAHHQRQQQRVGYHFITDTLGGNGGGPVANQPN